MVDSLSPQSMIKNRMSLDHCRWHEDVFVRLKRGKEECEYRQRRRRAAKSGRERNARLDSWTSLFLWSEGNEKREGERAREREREREGGKNEERYRSQRNHSRRNNHRITSKFFRSISPKSLGLIGYRRRETERILSLLSTSQRHSVHCFSSSTLRVAHGWCLAED